jgi:chorismate dehydratase
LSHPIKISIVGYTNTLPFRFGIRHFFSENEIEISSDTPADCARKLLDNEVDLGLVPVAILKQLSSAKTYSGFCIGADGKVDSVKLYSEVPLREIKTITLDYQSRTSVELVKILCREHWKISVEFVQGAEGFENKIAGTNAAVIIGDRTFCIAGRYKFEFDLAEGWKELTGLPFVFAAWASSKQLSEEFVSKFNKALAYGCAHIESSLEGAEIPCLSRSQALFYLKERISYPFDEARKQALVRFLDWLV